MHVLRMVGWLPVPRKYAHLVHGVLRLLLRGLLHKVRRPPRLLSLHAMAGRDGKFIKHGLPI